VIKVIYYLSLLNAAGWLIGLLAGEMRGDEGIAVLIIIASLIVVIATNSKDSYISILFRSTVKFIIRNFTAHKDKLKKYLDE
jgi:hypothetical protein